MSFLSAKLEALLLPMVYKDTELKTIINAAAEFLNTPVRFSPENNLDFALCSPGYPNEDIEYIRGVLADDPQGFQTYMQVIHQKASDTPVLLKSGNSAIPDKIFCNVVIGSRYFGNVSIPHVKLPLKEIDLDVVETLCKIIALACSVQGLWGYDRENYNLFNALLHGIITRWDQLAGMTSDIRAYQDRQWRLVSCQLPEPLNPGLIVSGLERIFPGALIASYDQSMNVLVDVTDQDLTALQLQRLTSLTSAFQISICIGLVFHNLMDCRKQLACIADHPDMKNRNLPQLISFDKHPEYALFHHTGFSYQELSEYRDQRIDSLIEHDLQHGTEYFITLKTMLTCNCNPAETAGILCTHKNTILYRIKRIEELFHLCLSDNETLFQIMLSLKIMEYGHAELN